MTLTRRTPTCGSEPPVPLNMSLLEALWHVTHCLHVDSSVRLSTTQKSGLVHATHHYKQKLTEFPNENNGGRHVFSAGELLDRDTHKQKETEPHRDDHVVAVFLAIQYHGLPIMSQNTFVRLRNEKDVMIISFLF